MPFSHGLTTEVLRSWKAAFELWFTKATRIGIVMARGAYWLGERKRLLNLLGMRTLDQIKSGGVNAAQLEPIVQQLHRLDEKLAAEELLIQEIRQGAPTEKGEPDAG